MKDAFDLVALFVGRLVIIVVVWVGLELLGAGLRDAYTTWRIRNQRPRALSRAMRWTAADLAAWDPSAERGPQPDPHASDQRAMDRIIRETGARP
jgi:hypothetical protein